MSLARSKIVKPREKSQPSDLELRVADAFAELEMNSSDLKAELRDLHFVAARECEVGASKKAIIIFVPYVELRSYHRVQTRLVRELEKKLASHVLVVAQRRIVPVIRKTNKMRQQKRPFSRTLTAVHDAILEDVVYPADIVGKQAQHKRNGTKLLKVKLDKKDKNTAETRLDTFSAVYQRLTGKRVAFSFQ